MRPELESVLRTCLASARLEREAREALRIALDSGEPEALVEAARRLLGIESDRATPGEQRGAGRA